jgi:uncharacterized protein YecE (DUF72 family)
MPELKYLPNNALSAAPAPAVVPEPVEGPALPSSPSLFYLRLHGRNAASWYSEAGPDNPNGSSRYTYDYSDSELKQFVPVIQSAVITGRRPVVFFNNHPNGSGARNAVKLKNLLVNSSI